jgi:hypothetical protein
MDDLVERFEMTGPSLVKEVSTRLGPGTSIENTLNTVRDIQMRRYARLIKMEKIDNVFESIEYLWKNFELNTEDIQSVLGFVPEFPKVSSPLVDRFLEHMRPKTRPGGCFTWVRSRCS